MVKERFWRRIPVLIGELAQRSGLSRDTLRFYEKLGLFEGHVTRSGNNNYKDYADALLERLFLIKQAKLLGFSLKEAQHLMLDWETDRISPAEKIGIFQDKLAYIDSKIVELHGVRTYLLQKMQRYQTELAQAE